MEFPTTFMFFKAGSDDNIVPSPLSHADYDLDQSRKLGWL